MLYFVSTMYKSDAIAHFGSIKAVAEAAEVSESAVYQWDDEKPIPPASAVILAGRSRGKLKLNPELYADWNNRKRKAS